MFSVSNLSVHFTGTYIFRDVSFLIGSRDRIGLVGRNGAGKTSLLRIINRQLEPEKGTVVIPGGSSIGYLPQELELNSTVTVMTEAMKAFNEALRIEEAMHSLSQQLARRTDYHSADYMRLITRLNEATDRFHMIGGQTREADTEKVLLGLGFERNDFSRPMMEFSSGWQMRVELAKLLLSKPDLLLLDEPTNHLDIESIQWLEGYLRDYPGAIILVSHDRAFLDNVTRRTIEISMGRIYDYPVSYSGYVSLREEQLEQQMAAFSNQQRQIAHLERFIERFRYKATKARQVQSRIRMIEKLGKVGVEDTDNSSIRVRFQHAPRSGKVVAEGHGVTKTYEGHVVFKDIDFAILRNDAVAFVGRNGEGKTTLTKIIAGQLDHGGVVRLGHNTHLGYYPQNQTELLDGEKTVFETIDDAATGPMRSQVRNLLGSFLFDTDDIDKKVKVLSGGEKARLALARLLLHPVNLLVLDEPTNHLDMISKDVLKNALLQYTGTLIIVSHDRDFLQGLTNKVIEFRNGSIREYLGDVYDFIQARSIESLKSLEKAESSGKSILTPDKPSDTKAQWEDKKNRDRQLRKMRNQIEAVEDRIDRLEGEIARFDAMLTDPQQYLSVLNDQASYQHYNQLRAELEKALNEWEQAHRQLEEIEKG